MQNFQDWLKLRVLPPLAHAYIRVLHASGRFERRGDAVLEALRAGGERYILAFWHSRWVLMPYAYPGDRIVVLLSRHGDAEMLARVLGRFGLDTARGSSTRGGAAGLHAVVRRARAGYDVGVAPDGPRGPRRRVQPGVIAMARLTGLPIVPVAYAARPARRLSSWDRTLVPAPFARGVFVYGGPVRVARDAAAEAQERARAELEAELDRVTDAADQACGLGPEDPRP